MSGKISAGQLVIAAGRRHLKDLERAKSKDFPYVWDEKKANHICEFAERMVHVKGDWAKIRASGELPFIQLQDWQCFSLGVPFGWIHKTTKLRRFREMYEHSHHCHCLTSLSLQNSGTSIRSLLLLPGLKFFAYWHKVCLWQ